MLKITFTGTNNKLEADLDAVLNKHGFTKTGGGFNFDTNESDISYESPQTKPRIHVGQQTCESCEG